MTIPSVPCVMWPQRWIYEPKGNRFVLDWRKEDGEFPYLHQDMYFESFQHAMQWERCTGRGPGLETSEELRRRVASEKEAKRLRYVETHQPWNADDAYGLEDP